MRMRTVHIKATRRGFTLAQAIGDPFAKTMQLLAQTDITLIINSADPAFRAGLYKLKNLGPCSVMIIPMHNRRPIGIPGSAIQNYIRYIKPNEELPLYFPPSGANEIYAGSLATNCTPILQYRIPASMSQAFNNTIQSLGQSSQELNSMSQALNNTIQSLGQSSRTSARKN
jgi:hypothetical protein